MRARAATARAALVAVLGLGVSGLTGCGVFSTGAADLPLPGGADLGDDPYQVTAEFTDVLDLVPQSSVKVDDVDVGEVSAIRLADDGREAAVTLSLNGSVELPEGTTARIEQTSLLGEKYVALVRPDDAPAGGVLLGDGATLGPASTSQAVEVEQVLGALSALLNGGGLGQFQEISRELTAVSSGRPEEVRAFLEQVDEFVTLLDERSDSITTALDGLARLGRTLDADRERIVTALEDVEPGLAVLADQREQLVTMLEALDRLSEVTVRTVDAAGDDLTRDLELLAPVLAKLADAGSDLTGSLEILVTYPFPDSVLPAIRGDYLNVFLNLGLRTTETEQPGVIGPSGIPPVLPGGSPAPAPAPEPAPGLGALMGLTR